MPWKKGDLPRRAGVSSFGFSGTNAHAIIEEAPALEKRDDIKDGKLNVITLSAKSDTAINNLVKRYQKFLSDKTELDIKDACYTANTGRGHYEYRIIMLIDDLNSLKEKIDILAERGIATYAEENIFFGQHKIVSDKRQSLQDNEIKEGSLRALNTEVEQMMSELLKADKDSYNSMLQKMCTYYVQGANIDWKKLHSGRKNRRVSLPTYPFDKTHYWADVKKTKITGSVQTENNEKLHYLIDELVISSMNEDIYRVKLSPETHWVLKEHVILGNSTVPGTAYIEIARAIGEIYFNTDELEINNFIFLTPLVVPNGTQVEPQIIVSKKDEQIQITVASKVKDEKSGVERWVTHAKGEITQHKKSTAEILDFTGVISSKEAQESPTNLPALNAQVDGTWR
nr:ketoacyl-synthetase C-terminal extension domain-containing protein [Ruminiclostridium josui]